MSRYSKSVVLLDDDPADLSLFSRLLQSQGFDVLASHGPDELLDRIRAGQVGCAILDQRMTPSGHATAAVIRGIDRPVGIVFLSSAEEPSEPLPDGTVFINKRDVHGLTEAVRVYMSQWRMKN